LKGKEENMITEFRGEFRFLSNFWPSVVHIGGIQFATVEHAYQAAKTVNPIQRAMIKAASTPGKAKRLGRTVTLRPEWNDTFKLQAMAQLVGQKFLSHKELGQMLVATGDQLIREGNNWGDTFWGVCDGVGKNQLGIILMGIRKHLTKEQPCITQG
jgi:ribA/ribD-fused uncharacterized protein